VRLARFFGVADTPPPAAPKFRGPLARAIYNCDGHGKVYKMIERPGGQTAAMVTCPHCRGAGCSLLKD